MLAINNSKKKYVVIASVNRPLDDHRIYEKWGCYFKNSFHTVVHLYGNRTDSGNDLNGFKLTNSLRYGRILSPIAFLFLLCRKKPDFVVCITFELLLACGIYKLFRGNKTHVAYDIIENYSLNLWSQATHSFIWKVLFTPHIRVREWFSSFFMDHYFYSDQVYLEQLPFIHKKAHTYVPNYYSGTAPITSNNSKQATKILITGTISKDYGIEKGICWFIDYLKECPYAELTVLGHQTGYFNKTTHPKITYKLSRHAVSHHKVLTTMANCDVVFMPYLWTESFNGCVPSKLYEALFLEKKVVISYSKHLEPFKKLDGIYFVKDQLPKLTELKNPASNPREQFKFGSLYSALHPVYNKLME